MNRIENKEKVTARIQLSLIIMINISSTWSIVWVNNAATERYCLIYSDLLFISVAILFSASLRMASAW
jgi:hypothetical protein